MQSFSEIDYIRCCFDQGWDKDSDGNPVTIEIYFARTNDLITEYNG
jgi:hypothetical protein